MSATPEQNKTENNIEDDHSHLLFEQVNPYGSRAVVIESDGRTVFMYLCPVDDYPGEMHAVWLANLVPAPEQADVQAMQSGTAPLMHRSACDHPAGIPLLDSAQFQVSWFQEGTGVVLFYQNEIEAIIPPWAGADGLQGYARRAVDRGIGTLPLPEESPAFYNRIEHDRLFWEARNRKEHWATFRDALLAHYENVYGKHTRYFAVTDRPYPTLAIVEFGGDSIDGRAVYATLGMSNQHVPGLETRLDSGTNPESFLRMEIITRALPADEWLPGLLARMAVYPWLGGVPFLQGESYESGMDLDGANFLLGHAEPYFSAIQTGMPAAYTVEDRFPVRFYAGVPIEKAMLPVLKVRGADFVLSKVHRA
ncbi:MAG: suppressor of fused domain protein [Leptospiraceae bacterium]|nr:suppressor of fused domain protein [Leptospiraceae bacterium]